MSNVFQQITKRLVTVERDLERVRNSSKDLEQALLGNRSIAAPESVLADNALLQAAAAVDMIDAAQAAVNDAHRSLATLYRHSRNGEHGGIYGCLGAHGIVRHSPDHDAPYSAVPA